MNFPKCQTKLLADLAEIRAGVHDTCELAGAAADLPGLSALEAEEIATVGIWLLYALAETDAAIAAVRRGDFPEALRKCDLAAFRYAALEGDRGPYEPVLDLLGRVRHVSAFLDGELLRDSLVVQYTHADGDGVLRLPASAGQNSSTAS